MTQLDMFQNVTSSPPDTHANLFPLLEIDTVKKITDISGQKYFPLFKQDDPLGQFSRTLVATSLWASTRFYLTWEGSSTPQGHSLYQLVPRTHPTSDLDYSSLPEIWPTLTVQDAKNNGGPSQHKRKQKPLNAEVDGPLNPEFCEWLMGYPRGWTELPA